MATPTLMGTRIAEYYYIENDDNDQACSYLVYPATVAEAVMVTTQKTLAQFLQEQSDVKNSTQIWDAHDTFIGDGVESECYLSRLLGNDKSYNALVSLQGVIQTPEEAYRIVGEDIIQFASAIPENVGISIRYLKHPLADSAPDRPTNKTPADGASIAAGTSNVKLTCSNFVSDFGGHLSKVNWIIVRSSDIGFDDTDPSNVMYEGSTTAPELTVAANNLGSGTFLWRCQMMDNQGAKSPWSTYTSFTLASK